jgi:hypothetical protein
MIDEDHAELLEKYHRPERSKLVSRLTVYGEALIDPQYSKRDPRSDPAVPRVNRSTNKNNDWIVPILFGGIVIVEILLYQYLSAM